MFRKELDRVFILSDAVGVIGGAARATLLLAEAYSRLGFSVTLFASGNIQSSDRARLSRSNVDCVGPFLHGGWRFSLPAVSLCVKLAFRSVMKPPLFIHAVGLTVESRMIFALPLGAPVLVWETTEANARNKFVHRKAIAAVRRAFAVIVPSRTIEENVRHNYQYEGRVLRLPFWAEAPPAVYEPRPRYRRILYLGRVDEEKGLRVLADAFAEVRKSHADATLTVCGGGDDELLRELAADGRVDVRGRVDEETAERAYAAAELFVLPSFHEGYPLTLLEAAGRGLPIVATEVGSVPEIFAGRTAAIIVPPRDSTALARAIRAIFEEDDVQYRRRCADARELFLALSSRAAIDATLLEVVRGVSEAILNRASR